MKILMVVFLTTFMLFVLGTVTSFVLQYYTFPSPPAVTARVAPKKSASPSSELEAKDEASDSTVPKQDETDAMVEEALDQRLQEVRERERQLTIRQETFRLILADIQSEQAEFARMREQFNQQMQYKLLTNYEQKRDLEKQQSAFRNEMKPATQRMGSVYDTMPAREAAAIFRQLASDGQESVAVGILRSMRERQAAKVLAELSSLDSELAASLTSRFQIRKPTTKVH